MVLSDMCRRGDLAAVRAHFAYRVYGGPPAATMAAAFRAACSSGHLPVAQFLYGQGGFWSPDLREDAFELACRSGNLALVQWLYALGVVRVRAHARDERCFQMACQKGHLAVAQWLHRVGGVDIHCLADSALLLALERGKCRRLAQWLVHLDPEYPWPARALFLMKTWSAGRHAWMRAVVRPPGNATAIS